MWRSTVKTSHSRKEYDIKITAGFQGLIWGSKIWALQNLRSITLRLLNEGISNTEFIYRGKRHEDEHNMPSKQMRI